MEDGTYCNYIQKIYTFCIEIVIYIKSDKIYPALQGDGKKSTGESYTFTKCTNGNKHKQVNS